MEVAHAWPEKAGGGTALTEAHFSWPTASHARLARAVVRKKEFAVADAPCELSLSHVRSLVIVSNARSLEVLCGPFAAWRRGSRRRRGDDADRSR